MRTLALAVLGVTIALGTSCFRGGPDDSASYSSLLRLVPDQPAFRGGVTIVDYEAIRALPGYEASRALGVTDAELAADPDALRKALGWHGVGGVASPEIIGVQSEDEPTAPPNWERGFGFGVADVDLVMTAGIRPPRTLHAIAGGFDPAAIENHLNECPGCVYSEQLEYAGQTYRSWGEGQRLDSRFALPAFDALGRGGKFVFDHDYVMRSNFNEELAAAIDASQGRDSLLGNADFALLAEAVDSIDLVVLFLSNSTFGPERAAEIIEGYRKYEALEHLATEWDLPPDATRLLPYQAFAIGAGVQNDQAFTTMVLIHESDATAQANMERFAERLASGSSPEAGSYAELFSSTEIVSEGRVLIVTLRGRARLGGLTWAEPLLLHE